MKKAVFAACAVTMLSASVHADTLLGLYVGGNVWDTETSGSFGDMNAQNNFDFEDEKNSYFFAALEHPVPLIPNIKVARSELATNGSANISTTFTFDDVTYDVDTSVLTDFDLGFVDYTLYYEILDNDLLTLDIGFTGRDFDGEISVADVNSSANSSLEITEIVPMLYASVIVGLPFTGFDVFAEGNFLSFDDHTLYDYQAGISYALLDNLAVDLNLNVGYRSMKMELEDLSDLYADVTFEGVFVGAVVHF